MNNPHDPTRPTLRRGLRLTALVAALSLFLSGCYFGAAYRYTERTGDGSVPWWCQGSPDLSVAECLTFSVYMDAALVVAHPYWTVADATGAGGTVFADHPADIGHAVSVPGSDTAAFTLSPNVLLYAGSGGGDRLAGVAWAVDSVSAPAGFPGGRDVWTFDAASGLWWLPMWVVRGYENHPDIFAATHPCLASGVTLASTADACFLASHTVPLELLVTNDDGYAAEGIDALVEGLTDDPGDPNDPYVAGVNVTVVAPLTQQSGQGDNITPGGAPAATPGLTTLSGYPVLAAVHGTPGDSVIWALDNLNQSPDLVMSGINEGQNLANIGHLASGTVGAARWAARRSAHSLATSSKVPDPDWPASVSATLALLENWRLGLAGQPFMAVPNINIPNCAGGGAVRGLLDTVVGVDLSSGGYGDPTDCLSVKPAGSIVDDLDGFLNGFATVADMGVNQPPNYP